MKDKAVLKEVERMTYRLKVYFIMLEEMVRIRAEIEAFIARIPGEEKSA